MLNAAMLRRYMRQPARDNCASRFSFWIMARTLKALTIMFPLLAAARNGNRAMVELLLSRGAGVNSKGTRGQTPSHVVANKGFQAVVEVLLANTVNLNAQDDSGNTPLQLAEGGPVKI